MGRKKNAKIESRRYKAVKDRYLELKAQDLKPSKIVEILGDQFFIAPSTVYYILKIKKNKLDRKQRVKTVIPQ